MKDRPLEVVDFEAIDKLRKDLKASAKLIGKKEARFLVDFYYTMQHDRIATESQVRAHSEGSEPNAFLDWLGDNLWTFESNIKSALNLFTLEYKVGRWLQSLTGIGPVITAGLLANLDIEKSQTYGGFWRFAGLDITVIWPSQDDAAKWINDCGIEEVSMPMVDEACKHFGRTRETLLKFMTPKDEDEPVMTNKSLAAALARRPWNGNLKTLLAFKAGDSFIKTQNNDKDIYGHIFARRKAMEIDLNREGRYAAQAQLKLKTVKIGRSTDAYCWYAGCLNRAAVAKYYETPPENRGVGLVKKLAGPPGSGIEMLPPDHINSRARRYAVKLFVAHLFHVMYMDFHGKEPRIPYPFEKLKHDTEHLIPPPNWPFDGGGKSLREMKQ